MLREEPELLVATEGSCAFCGKTRREVRALLGSSIATMMICDECLALCCGILAEKVGMKYDADVEKSALEFPDAKLATILETLATRYPPALDAVAEEFRCSFCERSRRQVAALVNGPRVLICDRCVGNGVSLLKGKMPATRA